MQRAENNALIQASTITGTKSQPQCRRFCTKLESACLYGIVPMPRSGWQSAIRSFVLRRSAIDSRNQSTTPWSPPRPSTLIKRGGLRLENSESSPFRLNGRRCSFVPFQSPLVVLSRSHVPFQSLSRCPPWFSRSLSIALSLFSVVLMFRSSRSLVVH